VFLAGTLSDIAEKNIESDIALRYSVAQISTASAGMLLGLWPIILQREVAMINLLVNGQTQQVDVPGDMPLLWVIRDILGLTGTKFGCGIAQCGACTVHVGGQPVRSCLYPISALGSQAVTTIEAVGATPNGQKIQQAWLDKEVVQCGYCQSGQIMAATALLNQTPNPTDADIDGAMSGNICRCSTYVRIRDAIHAAAG
jgi:isoquinoline 1-oxidoreductase alpha subunit